MPVYPASRIEPASKEGLNESGKSVEAVCVRWLGLVHDQGDKSALREAAAQVEKEFGGIDLVFANAGVRGFKPRFEMDDAGWRVHR